jgi:hypothetical protein
MIAAEAWDLVEMREARRPKKNEPKDGLLIGKRSDVLGKMFGVGKTFVEQARFVQALSSPDWLTALEHQFCGGNRRLPSPVPSLVGFGAWPTILKQQAQSSRDASSPASPAIRAADRGARSTPPPSWRRA